MSTFPVYGACIRAVFTLNFFMLMGQRSYPMQRAGEIVEFQLPLSHEKLKRWRIIRISSEGIKLIVELAEVTLLEEVQKSIAESAKAPQNVREALPTLPYANIQ